MTDSHSDEIPRVRTVLRQGALVKILRVEKRNYAGGGRRSAQCGHTKRSERRLYDFLLTCKPAKYVIFLTYPYIQGPTSVEKEARRFLKRLEKELGFSISAVIKMEVQVRLSPELMIALWFEPAIAMEEKMVREAWCQTIKAEARIKLDPPRDWVRLASYMSKRIQIIQSGILRGADTNPFLEPSPTDFIKRAHNTTQNSPALSDAKYMGDTGAYRQVKEEWLHYKGRFVWRYRRTGIPKYPKIMKPVAGITVNPIRENINKMRINHFVAMGDHISLRGEDAVRAAWKFDIPLEPSAPPGVPSPNHTTVRTSNHILRIHSEVLSILNRSRVS